MPQAPPRPAALERSLGHRSDGRPGSPHPRGSPRPRRRDRRPRRAGRDHRRHECAGASTPAADQCRPHTTRPGRRGVALPPDGRGFRAVPGRTCPLCPGRDARPGHERHASPPLPEHVVQPPHRTASPLLRGRGADGTGGRCRPPTRCHGQRHRPDGRCRVDGRHPRRTRRTRRLAGPVGAVLRALVGAGRSARQRHGGRPVPDPSRRRRADPARHGRPHVTRPALHVRAQPRPLHSASPSGASPGSGRCSGSWTTRGSSTRSSRMSTDPPRRGTSVGAPSAVWYRSP